MHGVLSSVRVNKTVKELLSLRLIHQQIWISVIYLSFHVVASQICIKHKYFQTLLC